MVPAGRNTVFVYPILPNQQFGSGCVAYPFSLVDVRCNVNRSPKAVLGNTEIIHHNNSTPTTESEVTVTIAIGPPPIQS